MVSDFHTYWTCRDWPRTDSMVVLVPMVVPYLDIDWAVMVQVLMLDIDLVVIALLLMLDIYWVVMALVLIPDTD